MVIIAMNKDLQGKLCVVVVGCLNYVKMFTYIALSLSQYMWVSNTFEFGSLN